MRDQKTPARWRLIIALALVSGSQLVLSQVSAQTVTPRWSLTGNLNAARYAHTATLLTNGKVLVAGGAGPNGCGNPMSSAEIYDPSTGTWSVTGSLHIPRFCHTATLLQNGKVLIAGNCESGNSTELYDPGSGTWQPTGSFNTIRGWVTTTLLPNGKVLAVGGTGAGRAAELYDPITGTWTITGTPSVSGFTVLLPNGKVLGVWEGLAWDNYDGGLYAELYDPATGQWNDTGFAFGVHYASTLTVMRAGKVLLIGGPYSYSKVYDLTSGTWSSTYGPNASGDYFTATLQGDGRVLMAGGITSGPVSQAELYDPTTGTWSFTARLISPRFSHTATLLPNGKTLVVGGINPGQISNCSSLQSAELFDPGTISTANPIDDPQFFVRQHYLDFLNREPDAPGLAHWTGEITECNDPAMRQPGESLDLCFERKRANTSAAFFLSPEFQNTGSFVLRVYWGTLGKLLNAQCPGVPNNLPGHCRPQYNTYITDMAQVTQGIVVNDHLDPARINANKQAFVNAFVQRPEFLAIFGSLNNTQYVDKLFQTTGISPSSGDRQALIDGLNSGAETRASVAFKVVDGTTTLTDGHLQFNTTYGQAFYNQEFDTAFVMMEYLGYLRRNPDQDGYDFWLAKMRRHGNWVDAQMVLAFIISPEYRLRFDGCAAACCGCWDY